MVDYVNHQATGLLEIMQMQCARLTAMVSQGDEQAELPLLWRICTALTDFGHPVTVLDGTTTEDESNPGLAHILNQEYWPERSAWCTSQWRVLPSAQGLRDLAEHPAEKSRFQRLSGIFSAESAVVVYANPTMLGSLLQASAVQPLLAVTTEKGSLLTSYLAIKQLFSQAALLPNVVCVSDGTSTEQTSAMRQQSEKLMDCAARYLGLDITVRMLTSVANDQRTSPELQRLVLRMLENAAPLRPKNAYHSLTAGQLGSGLIARGH